MSHQLPDAGPPQPATNRGPLYFLIGSASLLFLVVLALVFQQLISNGREIGTSPTTTPPPSPTSSPAPSSSPSPSETAEPEPEPTPERPAPEGAIEAASFTTPAKNIHCRINSDNVECSIYTYDYPSPKQCEGLTATYVVGAEGAVDADCQHSVSVADVYDYGTAVALNGFACTLEQDGVTCWSVMSGHGYELKRANDRIF
ncbi:MULTISPECIES: hypothetical protein [Trueperella]|uniref:Uncharacterized protein n=1 Tax=Trueperella bernardiae TaxID=59561 RepID=A0A0W1KHI9_9ACTO|nr:MULTISPECIES: hypothetical protein [Trueperella]KTF03524.1 hypothetical protein AQZ59_01654 [Trueperella bernardiae]MCM3908032.1 hypothetical protein [Trueperella bernardiae]MDK8601993.1 hypothetical protein [Trueperella bernardiae]OCW60193.1 hypothetical protein AKG36_05420 [Trueperella bernardiae]OFS66924.1 hypothetical protein HMPREF3174_05335 [Trueperella sp. HMSC08H06]